MPSCDTHIALEMHLAALDSRCCCNAKPPGSSGVTRSSILEGALEAQQVLTGAAKAAWAARIDGNVGFLSRLGASECRDEGSIGATWHAK